MWRRQDRFGDLPEEDRFGARAVADYFVQSSALCGLTGLAFLLCGAPVWPTVAVFAPIPLGMYGRSLSDRGRFAEARAVVVPFLAMAGILPLVVPRSGAELFLASNLPALFLWFPREAWRTRNWAIGLIMGEFALLLVVTRGLEGGYLGPAFESAAWWVVHLLLPLDLVMTVKTLLLQRSKQQDIIAAARDRALAAGQVKTRILNSVAHELRTPLTAAFGLLGELESDGAGDPRIRQSMLQVQRILERTTDLLDLTRLEGEGTVAAVSSVADPRVLVSALASRRPDLRVRIDPSAASTSRFAVTSARRVLGHLLDNAARHGAPPVELSVERAEAGLRFTVSDAGPGLDGAEPELLFEAFEVRAQGHDDATAGPGIGLPVSRALARAAGGELSIGPEGRGLILWLPAEPALLDRSTPARPPLSMSVLVVDDESLNRRIVRRALERLGCAVDEVEDGLQAVERIHSRSYDLVLMDVRMPRMDGLAATRVIKQGHAAPPVIALTANALAGDRHRCLEAGMDEFMEKPFSSERFLEVLGALS